MKLAWFAHILVHHPYIVITAVAVVSGTCLIIPFTFKIVPFPKFQDPQMGFSTRGTTISNRLTAWSNLVKSTRPSGPFAINPKEFLIHRNNSFPTSKQKKVQKRKKPKKIKKYSNVYVTQERNTSENAMEVNKWKALQNLDVPRGRNNYSPKDFDADGFFCGQPDERYAHVVINSYNKKDLFTVDSLMAICRLEHEFIDAKYYRDLCVENTKTSTLKCCRPWSVPNYIALLHNRVSCLAITEEDINSTKSLLKNCSHYFHNLELSANCHEGAYCDAPSECTQHDAVYNVLNFLTSISFLPPNNTSPELLETMIFLPLATSTAMLPYYHEIEKLDLEYEGIKVVAMEFGIKTALFDECLIRDAWLMGSGTIFIFLCMWVYTESLFLTLMTIIAIMFSMGIAYFMYTLVFEIKFFPFMNLLTTVVAIGIGADDAFIFCKIWHIQKRQTSSSIYIVKLMTDTFHHAFFTMFVTSLTTSVAFLGSYVSSVTAVSCFSIFAGTAVIANYILMMTWFPACVVLWERSCCANVALIKGCLMACLQRWCCIRIIKPQYLSPGWFKCSRFDKIWNAKEGFLLDSVIKMKYVWLVLLFAVALVSAVIVLYYPKLELPTSAEFQLFDASHPFEQYDFLYKNHFWFKREERMGDTSSNFKLPLRFVWGVLPEDNGDFLDPANLGSLTLDPSFDMSHPESQEWLRNFCENLRQQPFYQPTIGPLLPNCFVETFMKSMRRKCYDDFTYKDRSPCCETAKFPFNSSVFNECIIQEMADIYETPTEYSIPGMAGPKFSKDQYPTIKAVIVEYDSNYSYSLSFEHMHEFYTQVEDWMTKQLVSAPESMKNGWFISELEFYDLQRELSESTQIAIAMSMGLALVVLLVSTLNILTSLYAILTITCSIFVVMAILVLLGWKLNILESVAVSTAIGLAVDFSLHYSVNYRMCPENLMEDRVAATKYALSHMAGPALMAAITTGAAGAFMLPSLILPYIQIGIFLVTIMAVSWIYATFFLGSLLATAGPERRFGQFSYTSILCCPFRKSKTSFSERNISLPVSSTDAHELDALTYKFGVRPLAKPLQRSFSSGGDRSEPNKYVFTDQSPSATSAITIIMADDN